MAQQTTLRDLAKAYAKGALNQDSYRKSRADFLQKVISGNLKLPVIDYPPPVSPPTVTQEEITERKTSQKASAGATSSEPVKPNPPRRTGVIIIGSIITIVLLTAILFLVMKRDDASVKQIAQNIEVKTETEAQKLIQSFLQKRSWTTSSMNAFLAEWETLPDKDKIAIKNSVAFGQLTNAIYKKLLEEQALSGIGDMEKSMGKQTQLVQFADFIGIDDPRIALPEDTSEPADKSEMESIDEIESGLSTPAKLETTESISATTMENSTQSSQTSCKSILLENRTPYCRDILRGINKTAPTMVVIPAGKFMMGGDKHSEQPKHIVTIDYPFAMSVHEITYGEFSSFCEATHNDCPPQPWLGDDYPVVNISWNEARAYTQWLTENTGNTYRLPSEAEWEYAARAGTDTIYPSGNQLTHQDAVFTDEKNLNAPLPKTDRSIKRNNFRLYHMIGNVREWTLDNWHENYANAYANGDPRMDGDQDYKVVRGGAYNDSRLALRSAAREKLGTKTTDQYTGFRVVQELIES